MSGDITSSYAYAKLQLIGLVDPRIAHAPQRDPKGPDQGGGDDHIAKGLVDHAHQVVTQAEELSKRGDHDAARRLVTVEADELREGAPSSGDPETVIKLVRAHDEEDALGKGRAFAQGSDEGWAVREVIETYRILDATLGDGTELYSAFIGRDLAEDLRAGGGSPLRAWLREHPGEDEQTATVAELLEAWERRDDAE